jgi:NAD(P)H dehydrogenase (quinone)
MVKILITYYSKTGSTAKMAEYIAEGCRQAGIKADVKPVEKVRVDDLLSYHGLILGSPVYYGGMAAPLKKLIDESVKYHGRLKGKAGGAFASAGGRAGGGETTVLNILQALLVHGLIVAGDPDGDHYGPVAVGKPDAEAAESCKKLGRRVVELAKKLEE